MAQNWVRADVIEKGRRDLSAVHVLDEAGPREIKVGGDVVVAEDIEAVTALLIIDQIRDGQG
jgi:hypothetical protein